MKLTFTSIDNMPMIEPGDDLVALAVARLADMGEALEDDDVLVFAQKIISKAENRYLDLATIEPTEEALRMAQEVDKDPRIVQAILNESNEVVRARPGVLIVEQKHGLVQANAGIDQSNIKQPNEDDMCLLLPLDPDASARKMQAEIAARYGLRVGVIINDSLGRAWRLGSLGLAIGVAGFTALEDYIGQKDIYGRVLQVTQVAAADEMAAAASLVMGQTAEKTPLVWVRGYQPREPADPTQRGVAPLLRPKSMDLFR